MQEINHCFIVVYEELRYLISKSYEGNYEV